MRNLVIVVLCFLAWNSYAQSDFEKGKQLFEQKKYEQAISFFESYLKQSQDNALVLEYLGDCYGYLKQWKPAIAYYKQLAETYPENAVYHYKYGGVLGMKALENKIASISYIGDIEDEFKKAAELDSTHIDARWALVKFYTELPSILGGKQSKALYYANELEHLSKVDGYLSKGYIYKASGEYEKAETFLKKAVVVGGSDTCYEELIDLYKSKKAYQKAIRTFKEAHKNTGKNNYLYLLGKLSAEEQVMTEEGITALKSYVKEYRNTDAYSPEWAYFRLAQLYRFRKNKEQALFYIDKSIATAPDFKEAQKERSKILKI